MTSREPLTPAERQRRQRARRAAGVESVRIAIPYEAVSEALIDQRYLDAWDAEDRDAFARALEAAITAMVGGVTS